MGRSPFVVVAWFTRSRGVAGRGRRDARPRALLRPPPPVAGRSDGVIVTNAHVVGEAATVDVRFAEGSDSDADVMARDPVVDLAVVKVDRDGLPEARFSSGEPAVVELAVAIGSPLGFENTATAGIVSGLERRIPGGGPQLAGLLQTDAPISPGNSGGALVGSGGQGHRDQRGVHTAPGRRRLARVRHSRTAGGRRCRQTAADRRRCGACVPCRPPSHPDAAAGRPVRDKRQRRRAGPRRATGRTGRRGRVQRGDVIIGFGDKDVVELGDLLTALRGSKPRDRVPVRVLRGDQEQTLEVDWAPSGRGESLG